MKIKLSKRFFHGVFLTVRQIQLSLDRALSGDWGRLVSFFSGRAYVVDLAQALSGLISVEADGSSRHRLYGVRGFFRSNLIFDGYFMSVDEIIFLRRALLDFLGLLKEPANREAIVSLRLRFSEVEEVMRKRVGRGVSSLGDVEHFNQAAHLECKGLNDFVGVDWISSVEMEDQDTHK